MDMHVLVEVPHQLILVKKSVETELKSEERSAIMLILVTVMVVQQIVKSNLVGTAPVVPLIIKTHALQGAVMDSEQALRYVMMVTYYLVMVAPWIA